MPLNSEEREKVSIGKMNMRNRSFWHSEKNKIIPIEMCTLHTLWTYMIGMSNLMYAVQSVAACMISAENAIHIIRDKHFSSSTTNKNFLTKNGKRRTRTRRRTRKIKQTEEEASQCQSFTRDRWCSKCIPCTYKGHTVRCALFACGCMCHGNARNNF